MTAKRDMKRLHVTATGETFYTDDAGIKYFKDMIFHIKGQYSKVDTLQKQVDEAWHAHTMMTQDRDSLMEIRNGVSEALCRVPVDPQHPTLVAHAAHVVDLLEASKKRGEDSLRWSNNYRLALNLIKDTLNDPEYVGDRTRLLDKLVEIVRDGLDEVLPEQTGLGN